MFVLNDFESEPPDFDGILTEKYITIAAAVRLTGYNSQYLRRLLRNGRLPGVRVGQTWLIQYEPLMSYLSAMSISTDRRCGSKNSPFSSKPE